MGIEWNLKSKVLMAAVGLVAFCGCVNFPVVADTDEAKAKKLFGVLVADKNQNSIGLTGQKRKPKFDKKKLEEYDNSSWASKFKNQMIWSYGEEFRWYAKKIADYKQKADKLYRVVSDFVNKAQRDGCSDEDFEDYIEDYIGKGEKIEVCSKDKFEDLCNQGYRRVFRGVNNQKFAQDLMNGEFFAGGNASFDDVRKFGVASLLSSEKSNVHGHGLYTTAQVHFAEDFSSQQVKNDKAGLKWTSCGGNIVELGIHPDAKFINAYDLDLTKKALLIFHPEIFGSVKLFKKGFDPRSYGLLFSSIFKPFRKAFKEAFGFDILEIRQHAERVDKLVAESDKQKGVKKHRDSDFVRPEGEDDSYVAYESGSGGMFYDMFSSYVYDFLINVVNKYSKKFAKEFDRLMKQNNEPLYYTNKFYAALQDDGLLAKLLGYDGVLDATLPRDTIRILDRRAGHSTQHDYYSVVNPDVLVVCNEEFEQPSPDFDKLWSKEKSGDIIIELGRIIAP